MAADGVEYAYRDVGDATRPALVLLQRFRGNLDNWDPALVDELARHRRVITVDYQGVDGSSGRTADTIEQMAREVLAFTTAIELDSYDLLGFSIGSFVAQRVALARPDAIGKVVLASTAPEGARGMHGWAAAVIEAVDKPQTSGEEYLSVFFPVFVANGDSDPMILPRYSYLIAGLLPDATLKIYPDSAHGFLFQHHQEFAADVIAFLGPRAMMEGGVVPTKTADEVVRLALEAQAGLESWQRVASVTATVDLNGVVWEAETRDHPLSRVRVTVETGDQRTSVTPFGQRGRRSSYSPPLAAVLLDEGRVAAAQTHPRAAFATDTEDAAWDELQVAYFTGFAFWNYLNLPFLLARPGFTVHDVTPYRSGDAAWQRVSYSYPDEIATHNRTQALHIGARGHAADTGPRPHGDSAKGFTAESGWTDPPSTHTRHHSDSHYWPGGRSIAHGLHQIGLGPVPSEACWRTARRGLLSWCGSRQSQHDGYVDLGRQVCENDLSAQ